MKSKKLEVGTVLGSFKIAKRESFLNGEALILVEKGEKNRGTKKNVGIRKK